MQFWEGERCEYCQGVIVEKKVSLSRKVKGKYVFLENVPAGKRRFAGAARLNAKSSCLCTRCDSALVPVSGRFLRHPNLATP